MRARSVAHNGILLGTVLLLGILTGCTGATDAAQPSPTPSSTTATADDIAAAKAAYLAYVDAYNGIDYSNDESVNNVLDRTAEPLQSLDRKQIADVRERGLRREGVAKVTLLEASKSSGTTEVVALNACFDVSETHYVDAEGTVWGNKKITDVTALAVTMVKKTDERTQKWLVSALDSRDGDPKCT